MPLINDFAAEEGCQENDESSKQSAGELNRRLFFWSIFPNEDPRGVNSKNGDGTVEVKTDLTLDSMKSACIHESRDDCGEHEEKTEIKGESRKSKISRIFPRSPKK